MLWIKHGLRTHPNRALVKTSFQPFGQLARLAASTIRPASNETVRPARPRVPDLAVPHIRQRRRFLFKYWIARRFIFSANAHSLGFLSLICGGTCSNPPHFACTSGLLRKYFRGDRITNLSQVSARPLRLALPCLSPSPAASIWILPLPRSIDFGSSSCFVVVFVVCNQWGHLDSGMIGIVDQF